MKTINMLSSVILSFVLCFGSPVSFVVAEENITLPEPIKVIDFSYSFDELAEQDEQFEVVENDAAPTLIQDEEMGQVLKLGKAVIDGQEFGEADNLVADSSQYSTIKVTNPYVGRDYLREYEPYEDVKTVQYRNVNQPDWEEGITISYWIKSPVGVNSNVVGFTSERFQMQADDYAKHLCTVKFDLEYNQMTDEERKLNNVNESGVLPDSDFYFEYAGYDEEGNPLMHEGKPLYAGLGNGSLGRTYWMNKFYEPGYLSKSDGTISVSYDFGSYEEYAEAPYLGNTEDDHNPGTSNIRYGWTYSEMWLDATSSFYFENDNAYDIQLNPNREDSYGKTMGMQDKNCFNINSWKNAMSIEEAVEEEKVAPSPVSQPDQWHFVTVVIQNDWVLYYLDGKEIDIESNYSSYGGSGLISVGLESSRQPWSRFNKGTGSRYGYGNTRGTVRWCFYGYYVSATIMEWLTMECTKMTIGGGNRNGDGYLMYANTDEILLKNVVFYDKMLNLKQIEYLAQNPDIFTKTYEVGDVNKDDAVNATDALLVLRHVAKIEELTEDQLALADIAADENINAEDALEILKYAAGLRD